MASSGLPNSQWAAVPQKKARPVLKFDIEEGTKAFRQMLSQSSNRSQTKPATSPVTSQPQADLGVDPPKPAHQQERSNNASQTSGRLASTTTIEPVTSKPQVVVERLPPHLSWQRENVKIASQAPDSHASENVIEPATREGDLRGQQVTTPPNCPGPSEPRPRTTHQNRPSPLQSCFQPTPSREAPLNVAPKHAYPPTPASPEFTKMVLLAEANTSTHPYLKKVVGNQFRIAVRKDSPFGSPVSPAWDNATGVRSEDRTSKTHGASQIKKWRPKHSEDLESQSLPSTAASVKFSDDDTCHFPDRSQDGEGASFNDVRANIAEELDIVRNDNGNGWVNKNAWKDYPSSAPSNGYADEGSLGSFVRGWKATYCEDWVDSLPGSPPPVAFAIGNQADQHWKCDIDTKNGFLMSPVEYPSTEINQDDPSSGPELDRRLRGTAAMKSTVEFLQMQKREVQRDKKEREYNARNPPPNLLRKQSTSPMAQSSPAPVPKPVAKPSVEPVQQIQQTGQGNVAATQISVEPIQRAVQDDIGGHQLKVPCYLRPAERADALQILEIYNWEVMNGSQALDTMPLALQDIQNLLAKCQSVKMPFIVAVQGTPMEAAWRKEAPAQPRGPYKQPRPMGPYQKAPEAQPRSDKILGFGFISCPVPGLAGSVQSNVGRFIGKVHFYVEHTSRRNGIGRAILDRLTRCCSKFCISVDWYQWHDPARSAVFDEPDYNARNYSRLYIETSSAGEEDPDNGWYEKFLDGMGYMFMSTLDKTRKVKYGPSGQWRDTIVWQHDCRDHKYITEFV